MYQRKLSRSEECHCWFEHQFCIMRNIKSFLVLLKGSKNHESTNTYLVENIANLMDRIVVRMSEMKESVLRKIQKGELGYIFTPNEQIIANVMKMLESEKLTGKVVHQLISPYIKKQKDLVKIIEQQIQTFEKCLLKRLDQSINDQLFEKSSIVYWDEGLKRTDLSIQKGTVSQKVYQDNFSACLLSPSIPKLKGSIVKWKIKCLSISNKVGIGICLKQNAMFQNFNMANSVQSNGTYMIFNDGLVYAYKDKAKNNKTKGFKFQAGQVIAVEFDKQNNVIRFRNQTLDLSTELKILATLLDDEYHIAVSLYRSQDKIQLLEPIETNLMSYMIGTNQDKT